MCTFFITSSVGLTVFSNTYPTNIQPPKYRIDFQIRALLPIFTCLKVSKTNFLKLICRLLYQNYLHGTDCVHLNLIGILYVHASSHLTHKLSFCCTVVPVMNGHHRDQAKVSVHCMWPPITGTLTLKCVGRGIDNVAVQGRWPLTTGVA